MVFHDLPPLGTMIDITEAALSRWEVLREYNIQQMEVVGYYNKHPSYPHGRPTFLCWSPLLNYGHSLEDVHNLCNTVLKRGGNGYWWLWKEDYTFTHPFLTIEECM